MAVITKKDEKIENVVGELNEGYLFDDFINKFQELYPKDWSKIEREHAKHERKTKPEKSHPMPEPIQSTPAFATERILSIAEICIGLSLIWLFFSAAKIYKSR